MNPRTGTKIIKKYTVRNKTQPLYGTENGMPVCVIMQLSELSVCPSVCLSAWCQEESYGWEVCGLSLCTDKTSVTSILLSYKFKRPLTNHQSTFMETATA
jgi:hypothetical protein